MQRVSTEHKQKMYVLMGVRASPTNQSQIFFLYIGNVSCVICYVAMLSPTKLWHFTMILTLYFFMADVFYIILLLLLPGKIMNSFFLFALVHSLRDTCQRYVTIFYKCVSQIWLHISLKRSLVFAAYNMCPYGRHIQILF